MNVLPLVQGLVHAYREFEDHSSRHIKSMGLTLTQFDVIATLGNQPPMTCKDLGQKTLILKGTMTGVLERLEAKGLIEKFANQDDGRSYKIGLTQRGDKLFKKVFPEHLRYLEQTFGKLSEQELASAIDALRQLKTIFK